MINEVLLIECIRVIIFLFLFVLVYALLSALRAVLQFSDLAVLLTSPISLLWALRVPLATLDALGQRRIAFVKCFNSNKRSKTKEENEKESTGLAFVCH